MIESISFILVLYYRTKTYHKMLKLKKNVQKVPSLFKEQKLIHCRLNMCCFLIRFPWRQNRSWWLRLQCCNKQMVDDTCNDVVNMLQTFCFNLWLHIRRRSMISLNSTLQSNMDWFINFYVVFLFYVISTFFYTEFLFTQNISTEGFFLLQNITVKYFIYYKKDKTSKLT